MASCKHWCTLLALMIGSSSSDWVTISNPRLPRATAFMALGSYNDAIFIIGGYDTFNYKKVVEYSAATKDFTDHGDELQYNAYGGGDFYTQIDNTVYMLSGSGSNLNAFDMTNHAYTAAWKPVPIPVSSTGCLAFNADYMYVVGGYDESRSTVLNTVQVLKVSTKQWLSNIRSMKTQRNRLSCVVDPSTLQLYAIAGKNDGVATDPSSFLNTIEKINVNGMAQNEWEMVSSTLTKPAIGTRSIMYEERILVIGGRYANNGYKYLDTVHVIDPKTDAVTLPYASLPRGVAEAAAVIMNDDLYVFGGSNCPGNSWCDVAYYSYMVFQFPTPSPTSDPTKNPTSPPTKPPTFNPTSDPTVTPTSDPTTVPTSNPSVNPTIIPTMDTESPTKRPTIVAGRSPTSRPTADSRRVDDEDAGDDDDGDSNDPFGEGKPNKQQQFGEGEYYMLVIAILFVGICCASMIYVYYRGKQRGRTEENDALELEECHAITTITPGDEKGETLHDDTTNATVEHSVDGWTPGDDGVTGEDDIIGENDSDSSNDDLYVSHDKDTVRDTPQVVKDSDEDDDNHDLYTKPTQSKTAGGCVEDSDADTDDGDQLLYSKPNKSKTEK